MTDSRVLSPKREAIVQYKQFDFKNFKGIQSLTLPINEGVTTLIGLNESGKTTILEALYCFSYGAEKLEAINPGMSSLRNPEGWIPISQRANFNDAITITAIVTLDEEDKLDLWEYAAQEHALKLTGVPSDLRRLMKGVSAVHSPSIRRAQEMQRRQQIRSLIGMNSIGQRLRTSSIDSGMGRRFKLIYWDDCNRATGPIRGV
jgi:ABC-type Mn2+/Zn2+ transport system ATPase subunit